MKKKVLFLCTGNSCRSQMAEGLLRHLAGNSFEVASAGTNPHAVHPLAVKVMEEIGVDISRHRSKSVEEFLNEEIDYIITVCDRANQTCPTFPGIARKIHWSIPDPARVEGGEEARLEAFRSARDEIGSRIKNFVRKDKSAKSA